MVTRETDNFILKEMRVLLYSKKYEQPTTAVQDTICGYTQWSTLPMSESFSRFLSRIGDASDITNHTWTLGQKLSQYIALSNALYVGTLPVYESSYSGFTFDEFSLLHVDRWK